MQREGDTETKTLASPRNSEPEQGRLISSLEFLLLKGASSPTLLTPLETEFVSVGAGAWQGAGTRGPLWRQMEDVASPSHRPGCLGKVSIFSPTHSCLTPVISLAPSPACCLLLSVKMYFCHSLAYVSKVRDEVLR